MASLAEADRPHRGWRQIEVTPADKGTAIIDARRHAALVAALTSVPKGSERCVALIAKQSKSLPLAAR